MSDAKDHGDKSARSSVSVFEVGFVIALALASGCFLALGFGYFKDRILYRHHGETISATKVQIACLETAMSEFELHAGRYPTQAEGIEALIQRPAGLPEKDWKGPYLSKTKALTDGWKQPFIYRYPSNHGKEFDLISRGKDGVLETEDDFVNWDKKR